MGFRAVVALALLTGPVTILPAGTEEETLAARVNAIAPRLTSKSRDDRMRAESELKALGPRVAVPLINLSYLGDRSVRDAIEPVLESMGSVAVPILAEALSKRRRSAGVPPDAHWSYCTRVLSRLDGIVPGLDEMFLRGMRNPYYFGVVEGVIAARPALARQVLVPYLRSGNGEFASMAASILGEYGGADVVPDLLEALRSEDADVRMYSAQGLGQRRVREAVPPLLDLLRHSSSHTREVAAGQLGLLYEDKLRIPLAARAAWDLDPGVRRRAADSLNQSGEPRAVRLGQRYLPTNENPFISIADYILKVVRLLLGGVGAFVLFSWGVRTREKWQMVALSRAALLAWGIYWGRVITRFNGYEELTLLAIVFPLAAAMAGYGRGQLGLVRDILGAIVLIPLATIALFMLLQFWSRGLGGELYAFDYSARIALLALVFAVGLAAWRTFKASRNKTDQPLLLSSVRAGSGFLYFGYALGYLALWGYLGF